MHKKDDPFLERLLSHPSGQLALVSGDRQLTYDELLSRVAQRARELQVVSGSVLPLRADSSIDFVVDYLAAHQAGAVALPLDPQSAPASRRWVAERIATTPPFAQRGGVDDAADILLTSGTSGQPKGVVLSYRNLLAAAEQINRFIGNQPGERELLTLPLCHSFGLGRLRCALLRGGALVLANGMVPLGRWFRLAQQWQVTGLALVPAGVALLLQVAPQELASLGLRYLEIGSASMSRGQKEQLCQLLPRTRLCLHYGLTEGSRAAFLALHEAGQRLESIGRPTPGVEIQVAAPEGEPIGELRVRGKMVMREYWGEPQSTEERVREGWLWTGDLGWQDEAGYLYLQGRLTDLVNVGGRKVAPQEVERWLNDHPAVLEAACVGRSDPAAGQVLHAYLVAEGCEHPSPSELVSYLRDRLEPYKIPAAFHWVASLPKTASGKVQRHAL